MRYAWSETSFFVGTCQSPMTVAHEHQQPLPQPPIALTQPNPARLRRLQFQPCRQPLEQIPPVVVLSFAGSRPRRSAPYRNSSTADARIALIAYCMSRIRCAQHVSTRVP